MIDAAALISELKRRRVFRALVGYGVFTFALLQIIEPIMHALHWPDEVLSYLVLVLAAGFPAVAGIAWIFDFRAGRLESAGTVPGLAAARVAPVLIAIGLLAAAPGIAWYFVRRSPPPRPREQVQAQGPSIAVLPLSDLSAGKNEEYFADGMAEELLNLLAKVPGLHVAARTSSFSFKGKSEDLRAIAEKLNVGHILEGSVRRSGDRLRVTTQLINASDGYHLWSETYDRQLTDVFAVQDDIARAVVAALKLKLLAGSGTRQRATANGVAYNQYLLGRQFYLRSNLEDYRRAKEAYRKAVDLDPGYAPAWAGLSLAGYWVAEEADSATTIASGFDRARADAEKAVALGPDIADGYRARGSIRAQVSWDWVGAAADLQHAILLEPENADALSTYAGVVLRPTGRLEEAASDFRKAATLDPLNPRIWGALGLTLLSLGQLEPARAALGRSLEISPSQSFTAFNLALTFLLEKRPAEGLAMAQRSSTEIFRLLGAALAEHDLGHAAESQRLLDQMIAKHAHSDAYQIAEVYAWRGENDSAFVWLERARAQHDGGLLIAKIDSTLRALRGDRRWKPMLAAVHLPAD
jgi:TolB-like protein